MKETTCTLEKQEQIKTTYWLIEGHKIIPLGNFKNRNLTKENFKLYGIIKEKIYEISIDDFEISDYSLFGNETFNVKPVCDLFHIQKNIFLKR